MQRVALATILSMVVVALLTVILLFVFSAPLASIEERASGMTWTLAPDSTIEERVTLVAIDEKSLSRVGPWPWSREVMANLVDSINEAGAQLQIHDVIYPEGAKPGDDLFATALANDNRAIIAQLPVLQAQDELLLSGLLTHPATGITCPGGQQSNSVPQATSYIAASQVLADIPKGHIAPVIDSDGSIRKVPAVICVAGEPYPVLALAPFFHLTSPGDWRARIVEEDGLFKSSQTLQLESYPGLAIPLDGDGNLRISFRKSPSSFRSVSAIDILDGNYDREMFNNVWVLVGATAFGLDDIVPTPYSGFSPGVELQARMLTSVLDSNIPYAPNGRNIILGALSLLIGFMLYYAALVRGRYALVGLPLFATSSPLIAITFHGVLLTNYSLWVGWMAPALFGLLSGLALFIVEHVRVRLERGRVMQNLTSYLPIDTARKVAFELPSSNIQAERCNVTLLCADLRNFSALGESRPPEESAAVLHYFFSKVNSIVEAHGGRVHEYKGDSVLAMWDGDGCEPSSKALSAALEIEREVNTSLLPEIGIEGLEPLAVGIGIEQGPALVGSIGPAHRRAHTLCGETVSVTLRIQEMTADLASPILIGEVAARYLPDAELKSVGHYLLPGLVRTHVLFTPMEKVSSARESLTLLKGGVG